jgi:hypothetical protein
MYKDIKILYNNFDKISAIIENNDSRWIVWSYIDFFKKEFWVKKSIWAFNPCRYTLKWLYKDYKQGKYTLEEYKNHMLKKIYFDLLYHKFYKKYWVNIYNTSNI